jgi:hypothetical protein
MATMPVPTNTDLAVQNNTTGQVDFIQFQGSTPVASRAVTYASAGWNIVAQGIYDADNHYDLVLQNQATGVLDFLTLDASGNPVSSAMSNTGFAPIVGQGLFGNLVPGQVGNQLVSQLPNGELDILAFNASGQPVASDAIANTIGFAHVVGVGESAHNYPMFANIGRNGSVFNLGNDNVVLQLADGSLDSVGFSGSFFDSTLSASASLLLPGSAGSFPVQAVNQEANGGGFHANENILGGTGAGGVTLEGVQFVEQLANGSFDAVYADSGYGDPGHEGTLYASNLFNLSMPGWHVVNAGLIAQEIFPLS